MANVKIKKVVRLVKNDSSEEDYWTGDENIKSNDASVVILPKDSSSFSTKQKTTTAADYEASFYNESNLSVDLANLNIEKANCAHKSNIDNHLVNKYPSDQQGNDDKEEVVIISSKPKYDSFFCNTCKIEFLGKASLKSHLEGARHAKNRKKLLQEENKENLVVSPRDTLKSPSLDLCTTQASFNNDPNKNLASDPAFVAHFLTHSPTVATRQDRNLRPAEVWRQNNCKECMGKINGMLDDTCGLDNIEKQINYKFKDKTLLLQALTHSTCTDNEFTEDYEKLEFNGDHQLNFLVTRQLERNNRDKSYSPGDMTQWRIVLLSNKTQAWLAVENNFHFYLRYSSQKLQADIASFVTTINKKQEEMMDWENMTKQQRKQFVEVVSSKAPKVLADVFESVAAAIYFDSGDNLETLWDVYQPLMIKAFQLL